MKQGRNEPKQQSQPPPAEMNSLLALYNEQRYAETESRACALLEQYPESGFVWKLLGVSLHMLGKDPLFALQKAAYFLPNDAGVHNNLGNVLQAIGQFGEAAASYRHALKLKPDTAMLHYNLGNVLQALGQPEAASACYRQAVRIEPDFAEAHNNLGNALQTLCQPQAALASYRRALEIEPHFAVTYSNILFVHGYHALTDPREYLAEARNWELACVPEHDRQLARNKTFKRSPLPGRRLKVGYVSGDYRQHAVSYFIERLFTHHDRARIELFAYYSHGQRDAVTERLQTLVDHWVSVASMTDTMILDRIESDQIDVLIDLSGHTTDNRLGVFARRAAPVQAHYLGYFASTGLTEMDYFIGDEILAPPETDDHFSEQVWRLHMIRACYEGKADAPPPDWLPAQDGNIWLGSFNHLGKLTPATLSLWAKLLHALPEGRLLLKNKELANADNRRRILDDMVNNGISPDRIELRDSSITPGWREHMAYYNRLDIALDPIGAHGGYTTTCDALWMGAPVITLEGDRMASLMAASILKAIGHPEWIARSEAEYIDKVVALARDVELRRTLRSEQRKRMASSPLCDAHGLAMSLENAYSDMFERWLDNKN
jgi:protein O-GlcNAc transferase